MGIKSFLKQDAVCKVSDLDYMEKLLCSNRKSIKIIYGETFDGGGHPIDCLKYYLFAANLADVLKREGIKTEASVLVADTSVYRNENELGFEHVRKLGKDRIRFVETAKRLYKCDFEAVLMSDIIDSEKFKGRFEEVKKISEDNPKIMKMIEKTVPKDRIEQERKNEFVYPLEEVALISEFDIKIGPPREEFYDDASRKISKEMGCSELLSIYLTPTFPLTSNHNLDKLGLTPYKADSKGFRDKRIIIGKTSPKRVFELINNAPAYCGNKLYNPIFDMAVIVNMIKDRLIDKISPLLDFDDKKYKNCLEEDIINYIIKPFIRKGYGSLVKNYAPDMSVDFRTFEKYKFIPMN
ncbi:MAG: hypothetical protein ISS95_01070 [Candidatus Aenigmarchaeota archaeon]|nr:hypothetical protein [Candidatus Aenigmarchaeota archaeon]